MKKELGGILPNNDLIRELADLLQVSEYTLIIGQNREGLDNGKVLFLEKSVCGIWVPEESALGAIRIVCAGELVESVMTGVGSKSWVIPIVPGQECVVFGKPTFRCFFKC